MTSQPYVYTTSTHPARCQFSRFTYLQIFNGSILFSSTVQAGNRLLEMLKYSLLIMKPSIFSGLIRPSNKILYERGGTKDLFQYGNSDLWTLRHLAGFLSDHFHALASSLFPLIKFLLALPVRFPAIHIFLRHSETFFSAGIVPQRESATRYTHMHRPWGGNILKTSSAHLEIMLCLNAKN